MKKILINFPNVGKKGIHIPWLIKFKLIQERGFSLSMNGGFFVREMVKISDVYDYQGFLAERKKMKAMVRTKFGFVMYSIYRNLYSTFQIRRIFQNKYDVVYSPSATLDLVLFSFLLKIFKKELKWVTVFDNIVPIADPGNKILRFIAWIFFQMSVFLIRKADMVFVSTPELKKYLIKRNFSQDKLVETGFAIENSLARQARADKQYNIDALFIGRINETKGIYDMLMVLKLVTERYPNFQLAIMGEGDKTTEKQFKEKIEEMSLEKNVQFLGFKSGMQKYIILKSSRSFWFLSVSQSESFGIALLEAVCSGIPAFAYNLEQFSRIYSNGEIDVSPKGDYKSVAEKVIKLFEKGNHINKKGKLLLDKYSWERVAEIECNAIKSL